jgi:hypothetical protein
LPTIVHCRLSSQDVNLYSPGFVRFLTIQGPLEP